MVPKNIRYSQKNAMPLGSYKSQRVDVPSQSRLRAVNGATISLYTFSYLVQSKCTSSRIAKKSFRQYI